MNLIDENEEREEVENRKKMFIIIGATIAILIVIAIILLIYVNVKNNNTLKLKIDGKSATISDELFLMNDKKDLYVENNQIYMSVKKLSTLLGVDFYNDEYKNKGEDTTKCYIKTYNEYTSFISNSSQIYKAIIVEEIPETTQKNNNTTGNNVVTNKTTEYEYFTVENGVKYIDGEIYASQQALELGFNINLYYDSKSKTVNILTLDQLEVEASNKLKQLAVVGDDCSYSNKKMLKYGLVLIQNNDGDYGVANYYNYSEGDYVVSCKYSNIRFCESSNALIVTESRDNKQGILSLNLANQTANKKVESKYQMIKQISEENELYLVKENGKYGIISISGDSASVVLQSEYQAIGIEENLYNDMSNKYIINNKYIPVKIDNCWGLVTLEGKIIIRPQYAGIGCNLGETGSGDGVIVLPDLVNGVDGVVFLTDEENKLYSIINVQTGKQIGPLANEVYSKFENNQRVYYMKATDVNGSVMKNINIYKIFGKKEEEVDQINENIIANNNVNKTNNQIINNVN